MLNTDFSPINNARFFHTNISVAQYVSGDRGSMLISMHPEPINASEALVIMMAVEDHVEESVIALSYWVGEKRVTFLMDMLSDKTLRFFKTAVLGLPTIFMRGSDQVEFISMSEEQLAMWTAARDAVEAHRKGRAARRGADYLKAAFSPDMVAHYAIHPNQPDRRPNGVPGAMSITVLFDESHMDGVVLRR